MTKFEVWWHTEGSGMRPREGEDIEEFVKRMTSIAWANGEYVAQPEQPKHNTVEAVKAVLKGIDQTEIESPDGWWETSAGAEFGAKKLKYVIGLLAQPEQEPVAWMYQDKSTHEVRFQKHMRDFVDHGATYETPLYTTQPQRKPLTDEQIAHATAPVFMGGKPSLTGIARAIEAAHGIKGDA